MKLSKPLVVLDLETTGTWIEKDKIIEIAMIKWTADGRQEIYNKRVNPGVPIPAVVSELIGIKDEDVTNAPLFKAIAQEVVDYMRDCDLAGFNIERFDLPLLAREIEEAGLRLNWRTYKIYDVQKIYHLNEKRDLNAAYQFYCHKSLDNAHSAVADSQAALEILKAQLNRYGHGSEYLTSLDHFDYKDMTEFFDEERRFRWWNGKLYMMFGKYARKYSLQDVARKDRAYLEWILSADFSDEVKAVVQKALQGEFPVQSA